MTQPVTFGCAASNSLADLNTIVAQQEANLGPLIGIDNDGAQTVLTLDTDLPASAKNAVIAADQNGQPAVPAGSRQVCRGSVYIAGALTPSTASRPN